MRHSVIVLATAFSLFICSSAMAQNAADTNDDSEESYDSWVLEEVIVTAKRTGETRLQDTPIAITAFEKDALRDRNILKVEDLTKFVPNTNFTRHAAGDVLAFIRGVGTLSIGEGNQTSVGFYQDGIYVDRGIGMQMDFIDVERIEVLRGPQGTTFGRNTTGGAVSIISALPTEELTGAFNLALGNFDEKRIDGTVSGAFSDKVRARLTVTHREHDGYLKNIHPEGRDLAAQDYTGVRAALEFLPSDNINIMLRADYLKSEAPTTGNKLMQPGLFSFLANLEGVPDSEIFFDDFYTVNQDFPNSEEFESKGISATVTIDLAGNKTFKSITSYRDNLNEFVVDTDGTSVNLVTSGGPFLQNQVTQEFQLYGSTGSTTWLTGLYYLDGQDRTDYYVNTLDFILPGFTQTLHDQIDWKSWAVFASITHMFTDKLTFEVGGRYSYEEVTVPFSAIIYSPPLVPDFELFNEEETFSKFTPKLGLQYAVTDDMMIYSTISTGFKSGGFNSQNPPEQKFYGPENITSYEIGLKSSWAENRLIANVALFYYDYRDLQVVTTLGGTSDFIANAAKSTIKGAEFELSARPVAGLTLNAAISLLDATYDDFKTIDIFGDPIDLSGGPMPYAPDWKLNIGVQYDIQLKQSAKLSFRADFSSIDDLYWTQFADSAFQQKGYSAIDAFVRYTMLDGKYTFELYGQNLTDEEIILNAFPLPGGEGFGTVGAPRTYGIQFNYRY